jgi:hypothetical protein
MLHKQAGKALSSEEARQDLAVATEILVRRLRDDRVYAVVRRGAEVLAGRSLLEMAVAGEHAEVRDAVLRLFELPR